MAEEKKAPIIGRASATEREPSSSEKFYFWLAPGQVVNPFDIIAVEQMEGSRTFGLVTNIRQITDAPSHLSNFISNDFGNVAEIANTLRQGANVAEVGVLANDRDIYMPVQSEASVPFADEAGIHVSLGIDKMPEEARIPAGLITMSNGTQARVYLDARYVLGPEGAHVTISGISGLATKTSYAMFLIQSMRPGADPLMWC